MIVVSLFFRVIFTLSILVGLLCLTEPGAGTAGTIAIMGGLQGIVLTVILEALLKQDGKSRG